MPARDAETGPGRIPRGRWLVASTLLASVGLLGFAYLATQLATPTDGGTSVRKAQIAVVIWAREVLVKGLLPHLWITIGLWWGVERLLAARALREGQRIGLGACLAAATSVLVVSQGLTAELFDGPTVVIDGTAALLRASLELTLGTSLAAALPHLVFERRARRRAGSPGLRMQASSGG